MGTGGIGEIEKRARGQGATTEIDGHVVGNMETQCSENFPEHIKVTLERTPSNGEYGARVSHLL